MHAIRNSFNPILSCECMPCPAVPRRPVPGRLPVRTTGRGQRRLWRSNALRRRSIPFTARANSAHQSGRALPAGTRKTGAALRHRRRETTALSGLPHRISLCMHTPG